MMDENTFQLHKVVKQASSVLDIISENCTLSKIKIKDGLAKGCCLLVSQRGKSQRIRKAKYMLKPGDTIRFYYSQKILSLPVIQPTLLLEKNTYSCWYKPAGLLSQGTLYGDHCTLLREVQKSFANKKEIKLIHRLDRETNGLVILGHNRNSASYFSRLFQNKHIVKKYKAIVRGVLGKEGETMFFTESIRGKEAKSEATIIRNSENMSELDIVLHTGRKHQIRRHLSQAGFPLIGDPLYGVNKETYPLQLTAYSLGFTSPETERHIELNLPADYHVSIDKLSLPVKASQIK